MYQRTILPNGLRILTASMPHVQSVGVSVYIGTGSRYERAAEAGLSHFVEHLCFKGTTKRPTAKEVAETIDNVGGVLNAATDRELTVYYAKVARYHLETGLDILIDLVRNPIFEPAEVERSATSFWKSWPRWKTLRDSWWSCCWTRCCGRSTR